VSAPLLSGIRILDFSLLLPGPFCTYTLAELGAEVIKIEPPNGDGSRGFASGIFPLINAGKRSVCIDLKRPDGQAVARRLAESCDVVVEGFRPGVAARIGIGYEELSVLSPELVYCSLSGFGQEGPLSNRPGHDLTYLALSGALSIPGSWTEGTPGRSAIPIADLGAGTYAALAILAALFARTAGQGGRYIDVAIADVSFAWMALRAVGDVQQPFQAHDPRDHLFPTNDIFVAADGRRVALGVLEEVFWKRLVAACQGLAPRLADARFASEADRRTHGDDLFDLLSSMFLTQSSAFWLERLRAVDIPVELVLTPAEAAASPHFEGRKLLATDDVGSHTFRRPRVPVLFSPSVQLPGRPAPFLGADAVDVLGEAGYGSNEIQDLIRSGALLDHRAGRP
jgi:alpha-methylacyl-CoA racemase